MTEAQMLKRADQLNKNADICTIVMAAHALVMIASIFLDLHRLFWYSVFGALITWIIGGYFVFRVWQLREGFYANFNKNQ